VSIPAILAISGHPSFSQLMINGCPYLPYRLAGLDVDIVTKDGDT
jgi:hypothetical protein